MEKKKPDKPKSFNQQTHQLDMERLMDYLNQQNFGSIEEINDFLRTNVTGKRIADAIPQRKGEKTDREKAEDLMYKAYESPPDRGINLAKLALELDSENIRAYNYIADQEQDPAKAVDFYNKAEEIGRKQLGEAFFKENKGHFWMMHETRPYMTAKFGIGNCLQALGKNREAIRCFREMLDLNPNDNQGVRDVLNRLLLAERDYSSYYKLHKKYSDENTALWLYNYALFLFRTEGPGKNSNNALRKAYRANKHVLLFMSGQKKMKEEPSGTYSLGHESEAIYYLMNNFHLWMETDGFMDWIMGFAEMMKRRN